MRSSEGLVDSGSDVTIMSKSLFDQVLKGGLLNKPLISSLTSFSGNTIYVIGQFQCLLKLHASHTGISITIHVIDDIPNIPTLLLGNNLLQEGLGTIGYTGDAPPNHIPHVTFNRPNTYSPTVYFKTNLETMECAGTYSSPNCVVPKECCVFWVPLMPFYGVFEVQACVFWYLTEPLYCVLGSPYAILQCF